MEQNSITYKAIISNSNYRKLMLSGMIDRFGDSVDALAFTWLVYQLTPNAMWSAIVFGLYESALRLISQNTDPDVDEFSVRLCLAELKSLNNPEEALEEFKKINYMGIADIHIARILMDLDRYDESMDRFTRVLVSILIKSLQYSSTMAIALLKTGKKNNLTEARDLLDWCIKIYEATTDNKISYLTKMLAILHVLKSMTS